MNRRVPIVLLIEPDAIQSVRLARALKEGGYSVIPVRRADEGLETFATHHMDIALVVADMQSATSAGRRLLATLRAIDPSVPVVAMSPAATIHGHTDESLDAAATLTKPVAPGDLMVHVERVLQAAGSQALPSFCWPPTEAELDRIHVVDTQSGRPWLSELRAPLAHATPVQAAPRAQLAPVKFEPPGQLTPLSQLAPLTQLAPLARVAPPVQLAVRQFDDRRITRRVEFRTHRWVAVAATALCGLSLTTLLELRGVTVQRAAIAGHTSTATAATATPALSARHHVDMMPLVPAERISSRFDSRLRLAGVTASSDVAAARVNRTPPVASTALASRQRERIPDVPAMVTRTPDAAALPLPLVEARLPVPPPRIELAGARIEPAATSDAAAPTNVPAAVDRPRDDERGIYQVIQQYERAYERLDANAARAVWPTLNTRALARAFDGLKEQALEFSHCRVAMESREATAICGGRASYVPRVGPQTTRTEPREWTFRLRKVDHEWLIAKAEVR